MSVGSSLAKRAIKAAKTTLLGQYESSPMWMSIEKVAKALKETYAQNPWIFSDQLLVASLDEGRVQFERNDQKITDTVAEQKQKAHEEIEQKFDRIEDKKKLELQLASMRLEHSILKRAITIRINTQRNG